MKHTEDIRLPNSGFVVFGAMPGMGLTRLTLRLANQLSVHRTVAYVNYHIYKERLLSILATESKVADSGLVLNTTLPFYEPASVDMLEQFIAGSKIQLLVIDDLQSFLGESDLDSSSRNQLMVQMWNLARRNEVCVVLNVQLSRRIEPGDITSPSLRDFTWSRNLTDITDQIYGLYRPEYYCIVQDEEGRSTKGSLYVHLLKDRGLRQQHWVMPDFIQQ